MALTQYEWGPYKKRRQKHTECHVTTEAEAAVMLPQAKGHLGPPETGRGKEGSSPEASDRAWPCQYPDCRLVASRTVGE